MLNEHFLFLFGHSVQILKSHIILKGEFFDVRRKFFLRSLHICQFVFYCSQVFIQFFNAIIQNFMLIFHVSIFSNGFIEIFLEVFLFLKCSLSSGPCHLPLHQLDLIFSIIEEFLLFLEILIEFVDVCLQISACGHNSLNLHIEIRFFFSQLK